MPEVRFRIRWPDGSEEECYSPSTIVHDHLAAGRTMPLAEFVATAEAALRAASDRVKAVHCVPCSRAAAQIDAIRRRASTQPQGAVTILSMR